MKQMAREWKKDMKTWLLMSFQNRQARRYAIFLGVGQFSFVLSTKKNGMKM